jgi:hypothetical protein
MRERPDDPTASATNRYATNDGDARAAPYRSELAGYQRSYQEKPGLRSCDVVRDELCAKHHAMHLFACWLLWKTSVAPWCRCIRVMLIAPP